MTTWLKSLIAVSMVALVACGQSDKKKGEALQSEGQGLIGEVNKTQEKQFYMGMDLTGKTNTAKNADNYPWAIVYPKAENRAALRQELVAMISKITRVLEIGAHKNMKLEGGDLLANSRLQAQAYIDSLDRFEKSGGEAAPVEKKGLKKKVSADDEELPAAEVI